jgi:hypothetical protein
MESVVVRSGGGGGTSALVRGRGTMQRLVSFSSSVPSQAGRGGEVRRWRMCGRDDCLPICKHESRCDAVPQAQLVLLPVVVEWRRTRPAQGLPRCAVGLGGSAWATGSS